MKFVYALLLTLVLYSSSAFAETTLTIELTSKLDQLSQYMQNVNDTDKAWETMVDIADFIAKHPQYDDGEFAESIDDLMVKLLAKPWKYSSPYLIGSKTSPAFQAFVLAHVTELAVAKDLLRDRKNVRKNCDMEKYPYCEKLIHQINRSILAN